MMEFRICTVGKYTEDSGGDTLFRFKGKNYEQLLIWNEFDKILELERKRSGFYLSEVDIKGVPHVVVCYSEDIPCWNLELRKFFIENFFDRDDGDNSDDEEIYSIVNREADGEGRLTIDAFYEKLKQAHAEEDFVSITENVQHPLLRNTTVLRPYQIRGVRWMLKRELEEEKIPGHYMRMRSKVNDQQFFYYNPLTHDFREKNPERNLIFPRGGILCDEMGLGKTVEMIALILMNARKQGVKRDHDEMEAIELSNEAKAKLMCTKKTTIKCFCNKGGQRKLEETCVVCTKCFTAQHIKCVFQREITEQDRYDYTCCYCWKSTEKLIDIKATFVVSPIAIKNQWEKEIKRHVNDPNFKVLSYRGISNGFISPKELARYDCVITDFNTLSKELYFTDINKRSLRHDSRYVYPQSPLLRVKWWRVVLDEAQMVENKHSRPSQMVKLLPAVHRWCTTGTPIEKGSIAHLYGLIYFLDIVPYSQQSFFDIIWREYYNERSHVLIKMLCKVMWRTCKKDVLDEIQIPEQKEIIHYIEMSDLQKCFYTQVHAKTKPEFLRHVQEYLLRRSNGIEDIDYSLMDKKLYELNNTTIKTFLEPLRRIRQDCTIANVFTHANDHTKVKQTLRSDQLHDHLVSKTSIEAKSSLRTICSSLNGMAGLSIAEGKFEEAIGMYKQVLRLSKDYTGVVSVDSMLQIHCYHSLIEIQTHMMNSPDFPEKKLYQEESGKLEWKYISNYYDKVKKIYEDIKGHKRQLKEAHRNYSDRDGLWWRDVIGVQMTADEEDRLLDTLSAEVLQGHFGLSQLTEHLRTTMGIQLIITNWTDNIERYNRDVLKRFKNLSYIVEDLRPAHEQSDEMNAKINTLVVHAQNCHLFLEHLELDEDEPPPPPRTSKPCEMCALKKVINEYECTLFNKSLVDDTVEGTWNPRMEERLLKAILVYARRNEMDEEILEMGKNFFAYLEALKTRYRLLAQLWVEVNYTISAYDELNMAKMRIEVVDDLEGVSKNDLDMGVKVARYEVESQLQIFKVQKQEAEVQFTRLNGRLKYLEHLKEKSETPLCPICTNVPQERYYMTICAHSFCAECFTILTKDRRWPSATIKCPICREPQQISNIYAVTCSNVGTSSGVQIVGSCSPKIDEIIRCVIKLKQSEPDVKIVIFSHWDSILAAIITGLKENDISYRCSFGSNFNKEMDEFKDYNVGVTCMLMNLKFGGKGLNITEASHVFLVEPILNADDELQAIGRVHRIGQTKKTFVHKFITKNTIEAAIYDKIIQEKEKWMHKEFTIRDLESIFTNDAENADNDIMSFT